jgi:hypothetical protein
MGALRGGRTSIGGTNEGSTSIVFGTTSGRGVSPEPDAALHEERTQQQMNHILCFCESAGVAAEST